MLKFNAPNSRKDLNLKRAVNRQPWLPPERLVKLDDFIRSIFEKKSKDEIVDLNDEDVTGILDDEL